MQNTIAGLATAYGYVGLFFLVGLESLGIPLPGETALVTAAAWAALGHLSIYGIVATAAAAAILGDNGGYWLGRGGRIPLGPRYGRLLHLHQSHLGPARPLFARPRAGRRPPPSPGRRARPRGALVGEEPRQGGGGHAARVAAGLRRTGSRSAQAALPTRLVVRGRPVCTRRIPGAAPDRRVRRQSRWAL